jgi:hypothetical protein
LVVVQGFPGEFTWDTFERIAPALAQILRSPELAAVLSLALVHLGRTQHGGPPERPSDEEIAIALNIHVKQLHEVLQLLRSSIDVLAERLHIAIGCLASTNAAISALPRLRQAESEDVLLRELAEDGLEDPARVLQVAKQVSTLRELRDELQLGYRQFNDVLDALGYRPLLDPDAHRQEFEYFVGTHREEILASLRTAFLPEFNSGSDVSRYAALRAFSGLGPSPGWLEVCERPVDKMMRQRVNAWLDEAGAPPLGGGNIEPLEKLRTENRRLVAREGEDAGRVIRGWCHKHGLTCPDLWTVQGCGDALADRLDEQGLLDFIRLSDLVPLIPHMARSATTWPTGMPLTLDLAQLGLTPDDLSSADTEEEQRRRQRDLERRTIALGSRRLPVEPDRFPEIVEAVRQDIRPALLRTSLRLATLAAAPAARPSSRTGRGGRSYYRGATRATEQQLAAIGLVGEVIAFDWLSEQYKGNVISWRSGYRDKVLGGAEGDDTLGYDVEVITRASKFLFEVKSSVEEGTDFELTETEVNTARLNVGRDVYRIVYVRHALDPEQTSILLLPNPFSRRGQEAYRIVGSGLHYRFATA